MGPTIARPLATKQFLQPQADYIGWLDHCIHAAKLMRCSIHMLLLLLLLQSSLLQPLSAEWLSDNTPLLKRTRSI